jgi:23S rRNA U2552 (ribose-2'-O)-methylase RlmE/FtsJ
MSIPSKRQRREGDAGTSLSVAKQIMANQGFQEGSGLGARAQGITAPVQATTRLGTSGLGFSQGFQRKHHHHIDKDVGDVAKHMPVAVWLTEAYPGNVPTDPWPPWKEGRAGYIASDVFCNSEVLDNLLRAKSALDTVETRIFLAARNRANPFEHIKSEFFQNRAALKMAEMDAALGFPFTGAVDPKHESLLLFGDICAGPGGFSEYMLTVKKCMAKAFGLTLRGGSCDFKLPKFNTNAPTHSFRAYYGPNGSGDITQSATMRSYINSVWTETRGQGLHLVMGDGGFDVSGQENRQELLSRQIILCQILVALGTLRKGGVFVCKVFDMFLPFTVHVLYILKVHFDEFCIVKPCQSRPANAERYVVCRGFKQAHPANTTEYLFAVNARMNELDVESSPSALSLQELKTRRHHHHHSERSQETKARTDITLLVDPATIEADTEYAAYIRASVCAHAKSQITAIKSLYRYIEDPSLPSVDQASVRLACLAEWGVPSAFAKPRHPTRNSKRDRQPPQLQQPERVSDDRSSGRGILTYNPTHGHQLFQVNRQARQHEPPLVCTQAGSELLNLAVTHMRLTHATEGIPLSPSGHPLVFQAVPRGGERCLLLSTTAGAFTMDQRGVPVFERSHQQALHLHLPEDTVLDVVKVGGCFFVLDAWAIPTGHAEDLGLYRHERALADRACLVHILVESLRCPVLVAVPLTVCEGHGSSIVKKVRGLVPGTLDVFFSYGGLVGPPSFNKWRVVA